MNSKGEIVIIDFDGYFVVIFDRDGKCFKIIGYYGVNVGELRFFVDVIYVNDDVILVVDEWNYRI